MHIAIVDDDKSMRFLMERLLQRRGYRVTCFEAPAEAERAVRASPGAFDAVVTDHGMPSASGIEFARVLSVIRAELRVILVSGYVTDEMRERAAAAGVWKVLAKPLSTNELCEAIHRLLQAAG